MEDGYVLNCTKEQQNYATKKTSDELIPHIYATTSQNTN